MCWEDVKRELESDKYKTEYARSVDILNSLIRPLMFIKVNCNIHKSFTGTLFFKFIIDDLIHSLIGLKVLLDEGIVNSCKRELRYILELAVKACLVSQKYSRESFDKQLLIYKKLLKDTNISMIEEIKFHFFDEEYRGQFISDVKREYGILCDYVHCTPVQIKERLDLDNIGKTLGLGGTEELFQLNNFIEKVLSLVIVLCLHAVPNWCVGDWIIDKFSEEFVFCVRSIASESQAQNLVTALLALNKHCENLVVYIDVIPGEYNWAFLLQELQTRGLAVPVLISIRDEDYNATRISGKAILYDIIELQLTKEEAKTIYDNFTAGNPHSQHRSFDEAWINFGGNGPLIEFVYLLTNNQTLTQRLSEQVNTLLQERDPDSWLNLLNIVCFTGRLGCSVDFEHVKNEISCDSMFSAVQRLCDEYLIRVIDDGNRIEVLHPVRAKIIYDILCKLIGDNSDKMVISALKCVESTNSKVILLDYFTNHKYDLIAIEKIAKLTFSDWISYGNVLKVMLWLDVKRYVEDNANCISNLIKKRGKGWFCFIPLDFTGLDRPNEIIAESMLLGLPNINRDSMIQAIEETKASLTSLMLDYKVTDCFLTNSNIPSSMPNTDEGWTLFGYSLFWCSKREIKINLNYEIEQMLNEMKHGDIQSRADAIRGLSEYPELLEYYNIAEDTLIERLIKEFQVIYFHKNNDEVCCKFIPPFVKDSSEQNIEIEKNQNQYWRIKMLDILQQIYPDKEYIDIELIGVNRGILVHRFS